jgi:hypothetical protein
MGSSASQQKGPTGNLPIGPFLSGEAKQALRKLSNNHPKPAKSSLTTTLSS